HSRGHRTAPGGDGGRRLVDPRTVEPSRVRRGRCLTSPHAEAEPPHEVWRRDPDVRLGRLIGNAVLPDEPCSRVDSGEDTGLVRGRESLAERSGRSDAGRRAAATPARLGPRSSELPGGAALPFRLGRGVVHPGLLLPRGPLLAVARSRATRGARKWTEM